MGTEIFNQAEFMRRIDEKREQLGLEMQDLTQACGLKKQNAYRLWESNQQRLTVDQAVTLCKAVGLRPAWAIFDEGPKTDVEALAFMDVRMTVASLVEDVKELTASLPLHAQPKFSRSLPKKEEVAKARADLIEHLSVLEVGTKAYQACRRASRVLRQLFACLQSELHAGGKDANPSHTSLPAVDKAPKEQSENHNSH